MEKNASFSQEKISRINLSEKVSSNLSILLKVFSYIFYGIFFAIIISLQFISNPSQIGSPNLIMISTIVMFLFIFVALISVFFINFIADSYRKIWKIKFLSLHILNSIFLVIAAIVMTLFKISSIEIMATNSNLNSWILTSSIIILVHTLAITIMLTIVGLQTRKSFSITWMKTLLSLPIFLLEIVIGFLLFVASFNFLEGASSLAFTMLFIALAVFIFNFIYGILIVLFVAAFKTQLFGQKTNRELAKIELNREYAYFSMFAISIVLMSIAIVFQVNLSLNAIGFIVNLIILLISLSTYLFIMIKRNMSKANLIKSNDIELKNAITSNFFSWIFVLSTTIFIFFANFLSENSSTAIIITFASFWLVKIILNIVIGFKFPNIKNTITTFIIGIVMLFVVLFALILLTIPGSSAFKIFLRDASMLIIISTIFIGLSINFVLTILTTQKAYAQGEISKKFKLKKAENIIKQEELLEKITSKIS
ncbi:hypothetical protein [[Mycoplasma] mobile]|uniref:Expressed protein n=1 Tax=Mycoplasma mobile (strain ATCC 43663 / 163K / NCTC 11711) TaxID=267748 RepID=Q6KIC9_MYCM1|nr:hypothetical protein [[Mycoplasma] mobile]AAT27647.1 expressed protein [Mycoplasma mobile 163K]